MTQIETRQGKIRQRCPRRNGERGFTLVEILVVITIIALIMSLVGPRVLNYLSESKVKAAKIQMQSLRARSTCSTSTPDDIPRPPRG
jgi:prepilin-type N-terminal cleavage/methylation domain-containing protein